MKAYIIICMLLPWNLLKFRSFEENKVLLFKETGLNPSTIRCSDSYSYMLYMLSLNNNFLLFLSCSAWFITCSKIKGLLHQWVNYKYVLYCIVHFNILIYQKQYMYNIIQYIHQLNILIYIDRVAVCDIHAWSV